MDSQTPHLAVVGGGIAGLATAYAASRRGARVTLLECQPRIGGNIRTELIDGFLIDAGPDAFVRTKPDATQLCEELGLTADLISTQSRNVYVAHQGKLELMPAGMALAVPTRLGPMLQTPLLSWRGKMRTLADLFIRGRESDEDEALGHFIARRFGKEAAERLAAPLLGGIYAGDVEELSIKATFPQLLALERSHGSLIMGLFAAQQRREGGLDSSRSRLGALTAVFRWLRRAPHEAPSPFYSLRGGMQQLTDAIVAALPAGSIRTGVEVTGLRPPTDDAARWGVDLAGGEGLEVDRVALCVPAYIAARWIPDSHARDILCQIPYVSTATVFLGFRREQLAHSLDGVGFIVPKGEGSLMAATWVSSKWEHRAPEGHVLLRGFIGGRRNEHQLEQSSDEDLIRLTLEELRRYMGRIETPILTRVYRYTKANPQPLVGHEGKLEAMRQHLATLPGLTLAGAAYGGVGIPDCIRQGRMIAENLV